jgi:hypothetical protein
MIASEEEKELIAEEIYQRILDMFHVQGKIKARELVEKIIGSINEKYSDDHLHLSYEFHMVSGDFIQIIGRHRRKK